jgi:murein L,D-transpeptidase YafK
MKSIFTFFFLILSFLQIKAQNSFINQQKTFPRVYAAFNKKLDTLQKQFEKAKLQFPPNQIYLRSFKYDSQLEVWVRNSNKDTFQLFKTYKVCALSGALGPKRIEGDYQVPEGCYTINSFKPNSQYHLALGLNYPNASDLLLSDSSKPGGEIYVHGSCITVGCIPLQNEPIEEVYTLASYAKNAGQDFIPVHIFPIRYNIPKSIEYFFKVTKDDREYQEYAIKLKEAFDYFNTHKKLPIVAVNAKGQYVFL